MRYGYIRVSSVEQNEDRQYIALKEEGIANKNIYTDKISGKSFVEKYSAATVLFYNTSRKVFSNSLTYPGITISCLWTQI